MTNVGLVVWEQKIYLHFYRKGAKVRLGKKGGVGTKPPPKNGGLGGEASQLRINIRVD